MLSAEGSLPNILMQLDEIQRTCDQLRETVVKQIIKDDFSYSFEKLFNSKIASGPVQPYQDFLPGIRLGYERKPDNVARVIQPTKTGLSIAPERFLFDIRIETAPQFVSDWLTLEFPLSPRVSAKGCYLGIQARSTISGQINIVVMPPRQVSAEFIVGSLQVSNEWSVSGATFDLPEIPTGSSIYLALPSRSSLHLEFRYILGTTVGEH